jgi:hypothetical protein
MRKVGNKRRNDVVEGGEGRGLETAIKQEYQLPFYPFTIMQSAERHVTGIEAHDSLQLKVRCHLFGTNEFN